MQLASEISTELFQSILNAIKKNGVDGTLKLLKSNTIDVEIDDKDIIEVLQLVCDEFNINMEDLIYDRYVRGEHKYAVGFCLYYLYKDYSLGDLQKKGVFKHKDKSVLSRYRQLIESLDPKHKADTPYIKIKDRLDNKINNIKK
jgi:hypothetical protein